MATVEAYTKGLVGDAKDDLVFFIAEDDDSGWLRTNSVALLESANELIARLEAEGVDIPGLRALNEKWFPAEPATDDPSSLVVRERAMKQMGMPVAISMAEFPIDDEGGVRPSFGVRNISEETIEQVRFEMIAFSNRGDVVRDRDTGLATQVAVLQAIIRPGDTALFKYSDGPLWVNRTSGCVEIRKIEVTFQGGSTHSVDYQLENARLMPDTYRVMGECSRQGS